MKKIVLFLSMVGLVACQSNSQKDDSIVETPEDFEQVWRAEITIVDSIQLPFTFVSLNYSEKLLIENGEETIEIDSSRVEGDSTYYYLPVFPSAFVVHTSDSVWNGYWVRLDEDNYRLPFRAERGLDYRFSQECETSVALASRWEVHTKVTSEKPLPAIGQFKLEDNGVLTGSFARETGDYRFLAGNMCGNEMMLSTFDGMHAYVFTAKLENDTLKGYHFSGKGYAQPWMGIPSETFELRDPTQLTFIKEGYDDKVEFSLPTPSGEEFVFDGQSENGPTIIQIMGSWCPNCMDETRYFRSLHERYADRGLNIIGVTFEYKSELEEARPSIDKMITDLEIPYTVVFGGQASGERISEVLPMIDNFMSYPTSIFIDKNGNVRLIHTGFNGPSTEEYIPYTEETEALIQELLAE